MADGSGMSRHRAGRFQLVLEVQRHGKGQPLSPAGPEFGSTLCLATGSLPIRRPVAGTERVVRRKVQHC